MKNKVCADIREKFSDYIDELLPESEMADLEMHIKKCPACRRQLASLNKTVQALRNLPRYTAHPNIIVKINDRIEKNKRWWQRINSKLLKGTLGAIAAVILCVFGLQVYKGANSSNILKEKVLETAKPSGSNKAFKADKADNALKSAVRQQERRGAVLKAPVEMAKKAEEDELFENKETKKVLVVKEEQSAELAKKEVNEGGVKQVRQENKTGVKEPKPGYIPRDLQESVAMEKTKEPEKNIDAYIGEISEKDGVKDKNIRLTVSESASLESAYEQKGLYCRNNTAENIVIRDEKSFEKLWAEYFSEMPKPAVDFKKEMLIVIFLGERAGSSKDLVLKAIVSEKDKIKVRYTLLNLDLSGKPRSPYHIKSVKKSDLPVEFIKE
ncbi:MAG: zf-HC2 domain-containing protein [Candidatus Firestonebacteria bacterium]